MNFILKSSVERKGLSSIHERAFESEKAEFGVFESDQLFEVLAKDMRSHKEEIKRLTLEKEKIETKRRLALPASRLFVYNLFLIKLYFRFCSRRTNNQTFSPFEPDL